MKQITKSKKEIVLKISIEVINVKSVKLVPIAQQEITILLTTVRYVDICLCSNSNNNIDDNINIFIQNNLSDRFTNTQVDKHKKYKHRNLIKLTR